MFKMCIYYCNVCIYEMEYISLKDRVNHDYSSCQFDILWFLITEILQVTVLELQSEVETILLSLEKILSPRGRWVIDQEKPVSFIAIMHFSMGLSCGISNATCIPEIIQEVHFKV